MSDSPTSTVLRALRDYQLLDASQLDQVTRQLQGRSPRPQTLCHDLVRCSWLTAFQAQAVLNGKAAELNLGPYRLLEPLGSGGSGQVFKARHLKMNRLVALKVLRRAGRLDSDAVQRFHREIEVTSQLAHPNIIHALEAGPIGPALVLVMEYVDGIDLERLVQRSGSLSVPLACDYIRQAALGMQYAHERGLVHRDVKPGNLLITRTPEGPPTGLVKLLDLGLARLRYQTCDSRTADLTLAGSNAVTQGTPDYMAPEQALDFHGADIRSDLYSLGCTFYFLLAGQPPFAGGSLAEKLLKHQQTPPPPIDKARTDLPPGLAAIVMKLLAKHPGDRYQTPGELIQALDALPDAGKLAALTLPNLDDSTLWAAPALPAAGRPRRRALLAAIGGSAMLLVVVLAAWYLGPSTETAGTTSFAAATQPAPPTVPLTELVRDVTVANRKKYTLGTARLKELCYIDRDYRIIQLAPDLNGGVLIRTSCDDKYAGGAAHVFFTLTAPATVHVAYDPRAAKPPAWLLANGWQLTGDRMAFTVQTGLKVYRKQFPAGRVTLGGNAAPGAAANYLVVVTPER